MITIGALSVHVGNVPVDGWLPHWHTRAHGYRCAWMLEWHRLWLIWRKDR